MAVLQAMGCLWHKVGETYLHQCTAELSLAPAACCGHARAPQQISWCSSMSGFARDETGAGWGSQLPTQGRHPDIWALKSLLPSLQNARDKSGAALAAAQNPSSHSLSETTTLLSVPFSISPSISLSMVSLTWWSVSTVRPPPAFYWDQHRLLQTQCGINPWVWRFVLTRGWEEGKTQSLLHKLNCSVSSNASHLWLSESLKSLFLK